MAARSLADADTPAPTIAAMELLRAEVAALDGRRADAIAAARRAFRRATERARTALRLRTLTALAPLRAEPAWQALLSGVP